MQIFHTFHCQYPAVLLDPFRVGGTVAICHNTHAVRISGCFKSEPDPKTAEHSKNLGVPPESLALPFPRRHCSTSDVYSNMQRRRWANNSFHR